MLLLALCINKNVCLFHIHLSWAINAPHCLIRNKTQHHFFDHIKQCNDNSTFSFVTIALNICEGNHLATFMDEYVLDIFTR